MEEEKQSGHGMAGVYKDIAEFAGEDMARLMHENFKGQQIVFPNKLYSAKYMAEKIREEYNGKNIKQLARKYGYTERWLRKIVNGKESE